MTYKHSVHCSVFNYDFSKYSFEKIGSETKTIDRVGTYFMNSQISQNIHEQGNAGQPSQYYKCIFKVNHICAGPFQARLWRSLIAFFTKYKNDSNLNLTDAEKSEIEKFVKSNRFHFILRNQIVMNPIPKRLKKEETEHEIGAHEYHSLRLFLERVSHSYYESLSINHIQMISKTALDGEGIFQLGLIQDFFKKNENSAF